MASGGVVIPGWGKLPNQGGRPDFSASGFGSSGSSTTANTAAALAPGAAAGPLGSGLGLNLPAGYAAALTGYLDPAGMEAQIRSDSESAARHAAADRGFGITDNIGARLTGEIQAPALQAYRMNLMNQIPQFWQMEQQQQQAADARSDRARELGYQREQHQWEVDDRKHTERLRDEASRDYRNSLAATPGAPFDSTYGLFGGYNPSGAADGNPGGGGGGGGSTGGGPGVPSGYGQPGSLASHSTPMFGPKKAPDRVFTETPTEAAIRQGKEPPKPGMFDYSGASNNGGHLVQGAPTSGPSWGAMQKPPQNSAAGSWWK